MKPGKPILKRTESSAFDAYRRPQVKKEVKFTGPEPKNYFQKLTQQEILDNFNSTNYEESYLSLELKFSNYSNPNASRYAKHR